MNKALTLPQPVLVHCAAGKRAALVAALVVAHKLDLDSEGVFKLLAEEGVELADPFQDAIKKLLDKE